MYQILLRFDEETGLLKGASTQESVHSNPRGIKPEDWPEKCDSIRNASMATTAAIDEAKKELADFKAVVFSEATKLKTATLDKAQDTDAAALAAVDKVMATDTERKRAELLAQQDKIAAELAKLAIP